MADARLTGKIDSAGIGSVAYSPTTLLPSLRRSVWVAFTLAILNGVFLYGFPGAARLHYAWPIKPSVNAAFMGAGYLAGVLPTACAVFVVKYWRSIWALMWSFFAIGTMMLVATILHADKFRWHYPLTWIWTAVYVVIPPAVIFLWVLQRRADASEPPQDDRLLIMKGFAGVVGIAVSLVAVALVLSPSRMITHWPWPITPLLARAFAAWYLQIGVALLFIAARIRQAHEAVIPFAWLTLFNVLLLLLPVFYSGTIDLHRESFSVWLALHLVLVAGSLAFLIQAWRLTRESSQSL